MTSVAACPLDVSHPRLSAWISEVVELAKPDAVELVDGSEEQRARITQELVDKGVLRPLGGRFEGSYLALSDRRDVARVVADTHINSQNDGGPLTNWWDPNEALPELRRRFAGAMRGRTMYVIPLSMGPLDSKLARRAVQITDSPYVVLNMMIMARTGKAVLDQLGNDGEFVKCLHSVGVPLENGEADVLWPCNPEQLKVCHFPELQEIWSFGSGYGGNALLGKKCLALRMETALAAANPEGALAEHMLIGQIEKISTGQTWGVAAAFPSACGKTNLAMVQPTVPGYRFKTIGDDINWMRVVNGKLRAINPEAGFFGVAPGTGPKTNPVAVNAILKGSLLTNVAYDPETGEAWWPELTDEPPARLITWLGEEWTRDSGVPAEKTVHANARFTTPYVQCDTGDVDLWDDPEGVPIDFILFGGRRPSTVPLVRMARTLEEGVAFGTLVSSERTAAAEGKVGELARDMFAKAPFYGLPVVDDIANWIKVLGMLPEKNRPAIGYVNWFRKDGKRWLWPGFGDNFRVLDLIVRHLNGEIELVETPIGLMPVPENFYLDGLDVSLDDLQALTSYDAAEWLSEVEQTIHYLHENFGDQVPEVVVNRLHQAARELEAEIQ